MIRPCRAGRGLARRALFPLDEGIPNHYGLASPGRDDRVLLNPIGVHWTELAASQLLTLAERGRSWAVDEARAVLTARQFEVDRRQHAPAMFAAQRRQLDRENPRCDV